MQSSPEEDFKKAFSLFDKSGNGFISVRELKRGLAGLKIDLIEQDIDLMLKDVQFNADGKVSYEEFIELIKKKQME